MKQLYAIKIRESLEKIVLVKANELVEAIEKVKSAYKNESIILTADDYTDTEFEPSPYYEKGIFNESDGHRACYNEGFKCAYEGTIEMNNENGKESILWEWLKK